MAQPPKRNLPPDAEQWGRWVEQRFSDVDSDTFGLRQAAATNAANIAANVAQGTRIAQRVDPKYAENVGWGIGTTEQFYTNDCIFTPPAWAKNVAINATFSVQLTATAGFGGVQDISLFGNPYIAPQDSISTYNTFNSVVFKSMPQFTMDITTVTTQMYYGSISYSMPLTNANPIYVGLAGVALNQNMIGYYTASIFATAYWS